MTRIARAALAALVLVAAAACDDDANDTTGPNTSRTFVVTIENVSTTATLNTTRLDGAVPLSPGVYAVFTGANPLFIVGSQSDEGTERIAEDGDNQTELLAFATSDALRNGGFAAPGGADNMPTIGPGESVTFTIRASPGDRLEIETMFVQSNDWFYTFGAEGLALFNGNDPVSGDVTGQVVLYDAGTEEDTEPGTGPDQAPVQAAANTGPADDDTQIRLATESGPFTIPPTASVIRVTITPQ